ncbi:MAG: preprotein translocase subunit SecE [Candidatus Saccharimonadaceae bacterium]|nr:preprotein translocase subunit SecE [Candidatus Saccharimonadaceae bacterium]
MAKKEKTNKDKFIKLKNVKMPKFVIFIFKPFVSIGLYFKNSWLELQQVRWPDRKMTWGMTLAVILFSVFFITLILILDELFNLLFKFIIK